MLLVGQVLAGKHIHKLLPNLSNLPRLIAIMLGRLDMSVDECIKAYTELSATVFHKKHRIPVDIKGNLKERYDSKVLEQAIKQIIRDRNLDENTLLKDPQGTKV